MWNPRSVKHFFKLQSSQCDYIDILKLDRPTESDGKTEKLICNLAVSSESSENIQTLKFLKVITVPLIEVVIVGIVSAVSFVTVAVIIVI